MRALTKPMLLGVVLAAGVISLGAAPVPSPADAETRWQPVPGTSWQWQLSGRPESLLDVNAYDLDGFDTGKATVGKIHANGVKAMKNDPDQVADLVDLFDFAITEDCFDQNWCSKMSPFVKKNKAVLAPEYTDTGARLPLLPEGGIVAVRRHPEEAQPRRRAQGLLDSRLQLSDLPDA